MSLAFFLAAPVFVFAWTVWTRTTVEVIAYTLLSAVVFGTIAQALFPGHPHVPGSEFVLLLLDVAVGILLAILLVAVRIGQRIIRNRTDFFPARLFSRETRPAPEKAEKKAF